MRQTLVVGSACGFGLRDAAAAQGHAACHPGRCPLRVEYRQPRASTTCQFKERDLSNRTGLTVWFTGLSGSGKTTLCRAVESLLREQDLKVEVLGGDVIRKHLCKGLGFSREDRNENVSRIAFVAGLLTKHGVIALVAAIAPYRAARAEAAEKIGAFLEVFVDAPLAVCEQRDTKGLYRLARSGALQGFTGIDDPYEPPLQAAVTCRTDIESVEESAAKVVASILRAIRPQLP